MAKSVRKATTKREKDVDYTVYGLLALVAIVLVTALFFAQPNIAMRASTNPTINNDGNLFGSAIATGSEDTDAPAQCDVLSYCDGTKLIRRTTDCKEYIAFCQYGCSERADGAICR